VRRNLAQYITLITGFAPFGHQLLESIGLTDQEDK
jgi:hypothetical protein